MTVRLLVLVSLLGGSSLAQGQTYRCSSGGTTYLSDKPCSTSAATQLRSYGPLRSATAPQYSAPTPGAPKAQEHVKYLGSGCASISEAIRTGPARGVRGDVIQGLHEEYRQKCALEDQDARTQLQQDISQEQRVKLDQRDSVVGERRQAIQRSERCTAMRDVIALKRRRESELNSKEVEALRNLERTYNETCIAQ